MARTLGQKPGEEQGEWFPRIRLSAEDWERIRAGYERYCETHPGESFAVFTKTALELLIRVDESQAQLQAAKKLRRKR